MQVDVNKSPLVTIHTEKAIPHLLFRPNQRVQNANDRCHHDTKARVSVDGEAEVTAQALRKTHCCETSRPDQEYCFIFPIVTLLQELERLKQKRIWIKWDEPVLTPQDYKHYTE